MICNKADAWGVSVCVMRHKKRHSSACENNGISPVYTLAQLGPIA